MDKSANKEERDLSYGYVEVYERLPLGVGCYGRVYKARCGQLPCVAKMFHDALIRFDQSETQDLNKRLEDECKYLSSIKHPHLVMYLGFIRDARTGCLLLLMETMDENLTQFLETIDGPVREDKQIQICYDIGLGLVYLHSINCLHKNLSSNNVLLLAGKRAKVSDYGISSFANFNGIQVPPSAYMPPETLRSPARYTTKTDSFSFGVLIVQIVSKFPPNPAPSSKFLEHSNDEISTLVQETDRRKVDIDRVDPKHPLLQTALECLRNEDSERPTANYLCKSLLTITMAKTENGVTDDIPQDEASSGNKSPENACSDSYTIENFRDKIGQLLQELNDRDEQIAQRDKDIKEMDAIVRDRTEQMAAMEKQLQEKDELVSSLQKKVKTKPREKSDATQSQHSDCHTTQSSGNNNADQAKVKNDARKPKRYIPRKSLTPPPFQWSTGQPAPKSLSSYRGSAVVDGNRAYLSVINTIYSYTTTTNKWLKLPECFQRYFGLAVVSEHLVAVGGIKGQRANGEVTNTLLGITECKIWDDILPPMPTKRAFAGTATTNAHLIVVGGKISPESEGLDMVESLDIEMLQWSTVSRLPVPLEHPQLVVCENLLYALGAESNQVHVCSISDVTSPTTTAVLRNSSLIADDDTDDTSPSTRIPLQASNQPSSAENDDSTTWKRICNLPSSGGTRILAEGGQVLALGGHNHKHHPNKTVAIYDRESDMWRVVGELAAPKWGFLAVSLPNGKIMVVGGNINVQENCDSTDIASLNIEL